MYCYLNIALDLRGTTTYLQNLSIQNFHLASSLKASRCFDKTKFPTSSTVDC